MKCIWMCHIFNSSQSLRGSSLLMLNNFIFNVLSCWHYAEISIFRKFVSCCILYFIYRFIIINKYLSRSLSFTFCLNFGVYVIMLELVRRGNICEGGSGGGAGFVLSPSSISLLILCLISQSSSSYIISYAAATCVGGRGGRHLERSLYLYSWPL